MSLLAITATPMRPGRRPGHPVAADASTKADHLRALDLRLNHKFTIAEVARHFQVSDVTIWRWTSKAVRYPEAKQILAGPLD